MSRLYKLYVLFPNWSVPLSVCVSMRVCGWGVRECVYVCMCVSQCHLLALKIQAIFK